MAKHSQLKSKVEGIELEKVGLEADVERITRRHKETEEELKQAYEMNIGISEQGQTATMKLTMIEQNYSALSNKYDILQ
jgi:archaellum component FlaC